MSKTVSLEIMSTNRMCEIIGQVPVSTTWDIYRLSQDYICHTFQITHTGSYSIMVNRYKYNRDWIDIVTKILKSASCSTYGMQIRTYKTLKASWSFCQTLLSNSLSFSQESVSSMWSHSRLISLMSMLQLDPLSDWSICSDLDSCWNILFLLDAITGPSKSRTPLSPEARKINSLAWRIELSHNCLLKVSFACNEWDWLCDPFLKLILKKFLTGRKEPNQYMECFL